MDDNLQDITADLTDLRLQQAPAPVRASERPWEREGWLHPQGQWCWHWNRGSAGWDHRSLVNGVEDDTLLLPHWAIPAPGSPDW